MSDADKESWAGAVGEDRHYIDHLWARMANAWTGLDPDVLSDQDYEALFDRPHPAL